MTGDWMDKFFNFCIEIANRSSWGAAQALIFIVLQADIVTEIHMI